MDCNSCKYRELEMYEYPCDLCLEEDTAEKYWEPGESK